MTAGQRVGIWLVIAAAFILFIVLLNAILFPFVAGLGIAYLLDPLCDRLKRWGLSRTGATVAVTAGFFIGFVLVLALLLPMLYEQFLQFLHELPRLVVAIQQRIAPLVEALRPYISADDAQAGALRFLEAHVGDVAKFSVQFFGNLVGGIGMTFNLLSLFVITPIVAFYMLRDWDRIIARIDECLPRAHADTIREQAALIDQTLAGFVRGQLSVCVLLGLFYGIGLSLVGLNFGLVVGLATGLVSFVPYFGMLLGFLVGMGLAITQFDSILPIALVAGVFAVGQFLEGNFVTPRLVGKRVNLHAVWIIFALLAGGALFGFVGVLLAIPVAAAIGVLVRFALQRYLESELFRGDPPRSGPRDTLT